MLTPQQRPQLEPAVVVVSGGWLSDDLPQLVGRQLAQRRHPRHPLQETARKRPPRLIQLFR